MLCVVFACISGVVLLQTSYGQDLQPTETSVVMQCKGSSLTLNEPDPRIIDIHVFRGDESLASTIAEATGQFQDRLIVSSDGRVTLENLSADDLGVYRMEVKLSGGRQIQRSLRLAISEPPHTEKSTLTVKTVSSPGNNSVRLTCGTFLSLGFPPVSAAVWEDPLGHVLPSDGFKDQSFYLDLPLDTAEPGDYCCRLDCPAPTYCCLEELSPLRQCAQVHVQTQKAGATVKITDYVSPANFSQLQQQVQDLATDLEQLRLVLDDHEKVRRPGLCTTKIGYSWYGGRCLKFDTRSVDFQSAKADCLADGGHLLYLKSADIAPLLRDAVKAAGKTVPSIFPGVFLHAWVGATATATEGTFVWDDGTVLPKLSPLWSKGEPNDKGGNEDCVEIYLDSTSVYLNDDLCSHQHGFFCEYD